MTDAADTRSSESTVATVIGASGGIGGAIVARLCSSGTFDHVLTLSRAPGKNNDLRTVHDRIDITNEERIAACGSFCVCCSARVDSIEDNRLGGWYAYRASKAALNMLLKTCAIELSRRAPAAVCIGLHPGTVATRLSEPSQWNVAHDKLFTPAESAALLLRVVGDVDASDSGHVLAWGGSRIAA